MQDSTGERLSPLYLGDIVTVKMDATARNWREATVESINRPYDREPYITVKFRGTRVRRDLEMSERGNAFFKEAA